MEVHEKIRFLRESKDWSQEEMADKLNMSLSGYSKIERGDTKVSIPKLKKIAGVFETELMELMFLGEKHVYFTGNENSNNVHIIGSTELAFENQKQQLIIEHLKATLEQKAIEISNQKEIIELLKSKSAPSSMS
jgi:transcriptional regulator with XRE-family HTH domain